MHSCTTLHLSCQMEHIVLTPRAISFTSYFVDSHFHFIHVVKIDRRKPHHVFLLLINFSKFMISTGNRSISSSLLSNIHSRRHRGNTSLSERSTTLSCSFDTSSCLNWQKAHVCNKEHAMCHLHFSHYTHHRLVMIRFSSNAVNKLFQQSL